MALYQAYSWVSMEQYINNLKEFLEANNWIIDYHSSGYRLHWHKGDIHFDGYKYASNVFQVYGCTGYDSGAASSGQPNASAAINSYPSGNASRIFVSSKNAIYIRGYHDSNGYDYALWEGFGAFDDTDKIGLWDGGTFAMTHNCSTHAAMFCSSGCIYATLRKDGAWTNPSTYTANQTGRFYGNLNEHYLGYGPAPYNGGIVPGPVLAWVVHPTNSGLIYPVGYAPGIYKAAMGSVYTLGEVITIDNEQYYWAYQASCSNFLIKLEN